MIVLDTHVLHWWTAEPDRLSTTAVAAIEAADELAVAAITWYELAWLAHRGRIAVGIPVRSWVGSLSRDVTTVPLTAEIAEAAAALPSTFTGDPADRLIYATALETGVQLVTKDQRLRSHPQPRPITVW